MGFPQEWSAPVQNRGGLQKGGGSLPRTRKKVGGEGSLPQPGEGLVKEGVGPSGTARPGREGTEQWEPTLPLDRK